MLKEIINLILRGICTDEDLEQLTKSQLEEVLTIDCEDNKAIQKRIKAFIDSEEKRINKKIEKGDFKSVEKIIGKKIPQEVIDQINAEKNREYEVVEERPIFDPIDTTDYDINDFMNDMKL